jgi:hypothetical protein
MVPQLVTKRQVHRTRQRLELAAKRTHRFSVECQNDDGNRQRHESDDKKRCFHAISRRFPGSPRQIAQ